jgi:hypothetical protein
MDACPCNVCMHGHAHAVYACMGMHTCDDISNSAYIRSRRHKTINISTLHIRVVVVAHAYVHILNAFIHIHMRSLF